MKAKKSQTIMTKGIFNNQVIEQLTMNMKTITQKHVYKVRQTVCILSMKQCRLRRRQSFDL